MGVLGLVGFVGVLRVAGWVGGDLGLVGCGVMGWCWWKMMKIIRSLCHRGVGTRSWYKVLVKVLVQMLTDLPSSQRILLNGLIIARQNHFIADAYGANVIAREPRHVLVWWTVGVGRGW